MADDPYKILGIAKDASTDQIRKAYRTLAKKLHPDLNPGDPTAAERFREIQAAHAILSDPDKRARFDRGEIDMAGTERPQHRYYRDYAGAEDAGRYHTTAGFEDFSDIFSDLFARRAGGTAEGAGLRMRGQDVSYTLEIDFTDAVKGGTRRITLADGHSIDLHLPQGVDDGEVLRLKGKGMPGLGGGPPGDALVRITVRPHPLFRRDGLDILLDLPITVDEAVLGGKVETPTVWGRVVLTIPENASSGQVLRIRGKGIRRAGDKKAGDQLVSLKIVLPDTPDPDLKRFMEDWRGRHAHDPRARMRATS